MSFFARGREDFRRTLREASQYRQIGRTPYGFRPILVLTIVGVLTTLNIGVLGLAFPEIVQDLDLDFVRLIGIFSIVEFFLIFITLSLAWLADRVRRAPFVGIGTIVSGIGSIFSVVGRNEATFGSSRIVSDAVGDRIIDVPIASLSADYYPVEVRGKVFALRGVIGRVARITAPVSVAYIATSTALEWRLPYIIFGPLLILAGIWALFALKEPVRGYMERRALGLSEEDSREPEEPVTFGEAWRTVWSIRTLRRLFISTIPASPADFMFGIFFLVLLFEKYGLSLRQRGFLFSILGVFALPFGLYAGGVVDVLIRRRPQRVLIFTGLIGVLFGLLVLFLASAPPLWALVVGYTLVGGGLALVGPARRVLFVQILPAHVRTMGTWITLLAEIPGTVLRFYIVQYTVSRWGTQGVVFAAGLLFILSALIELSAAGLFERDMRSAIASQSASLEWRKARAAGRGKMLVCRDVDVEYSGVQVLFGVDFDVGEGELVALLGTNGAGKSTLLKAIAGVHECSSGAVVFDGRDITHMPPNESAARGVILMPGGRGIFPDLNVYENLLLGNWMNDEEEGRKRLDQVFNLFPVLRDRRNQRAQLLSGGEQQMLSLAQAFLSKPRLLMIDELSLGLAPATVQSLIEIVKQIHAQGTTVVIVEQSVNVALNVAERAIFMEKGEVKFVGPTQDLLRRPDILRAVYVRGSGALGARGPQSAVKGSREMRRYEVERARPVLEVQEVSKAFGGVVAARDVSFEVREGEILGLIGPNGAGKTTVFDLISGYQTPDAGRITYDGVDITHMSAEERARLGLVRRFQDARLFPALSVYENILVALERHIDVRSITLTALQVPQARAAERRVRRRADRLIEILELGSYRDKFVKELSTGLRRITDIACVLATEPKLLLLDEPSTGIAQAEAESLAPLLRRIVFETGCTMLVIEHDMPLISSISDELLAMDQGGVLLRGVPDAVLNDEAVIASYLGGQDDIVQRTGAGKAKAKARVGKSR
jgi:branched-chain amino acid transport system ATP-binding protein